VGGAGGANRPANRPGSGNGNFSGNNVNNINNIEADGDWNGGSCWGGSCGCCHHPVAAGLAVGAAAAVTAAAIGSVAYSLPYGCSPVYYAPYTYQHCGGAWYQPQFEGTETTYIVVEQPSGTPSTEPAPSTP
jgi:hypothetical protein